MRKVAVSFAAVMMVFAAFATPSFADKFDTRTFTGNNFSATFVVPTDGIIGESLSARATIRVNADGSNAPRRLVSWQFGAPDLRQQRSGFNAFPVGRTKTVTKSFAIPDRIAAGDYNIGVLIDVDGERHGETFTVNLHK